MRVKCVHLCIVCVCGVVCIVDVDFVDSALIFFYESMIRRFCLRLYHKMFVVQLDDNDRISKNPRGPIAALAKAEIII